MPRSRKRREMLPRRERHSCRRRGCAPTSGSRQSCRNSRARSRPVRLPRNAAKHRTRARTRWYRARSLRPLGWRRILVRGDGRDARLLARAECLLVDDRLGEAMPGGLAGTGELRGAAARRAGIDRPRVRPRRSGRRRPWVVRAGQPPRGARRARSRGAAWSSRSCGRGRSRLASARTTTPTPAPMATPCFTGEHCSAGTCGGQAGAPTSEGGEPSTSGGATSSGG